MKFRLFAAALLALLLIILCTALKLTRGRKITVSTKSNGPSLTSSDPQTESTSNSTAGGQTTLAISTIGVYLPGGLQVDGTVAYKNNKELARGGGGSVWLATALDPLLTTYGDTVIVKIPNTKQMNERAVALFHQEIARMNAFKHSQLIAKLLGYSENPYATILKFYPNGSLSKWLTSGNRTLINSHAFMKDISLAILLLHSNGIVHCDLKPDNVLIDSGWRLFAVITDFGISRIVADKLFKVGAYEVQVIKGASLAYAAPEALGELRGVSNSLPSPYETMSRDIYAFGVIVCFLLSGRSVWK